MRQTIADALNSSNEVPRLEKEILLAEVLKVTRAHLHTWPEKNLDESHLKNFLELLSRRVQGEPIAYITGHREFWSLDLIVTPDVLIPRHETELLVELVLQLSCHPLCHSREGGNPFQIDSRLLGNDRDGKDKIIADLGTGSGAIALAIAHEKPNWIIHATDASPAALAVAKQNAKRLNIKNIIFHQGNWCEALPNIKFDAIISNPPYIAENDDHLTQGDLRFEPHSALVSAEDGLRDISQIIFQSRNHLKSGGLVLLEHGYQQAKNIAGIFEKARYTSTEAHLDLAGLERVTVATWMGY
jgi:release factor glutamine methyltransferase